MFKKIEVKDEKLTTNPKRVELSEKKLMPSIWYS